MFIGLDGINVLILIHLTGCSFHNRGTGDFPVGMWCHARYMHCVVIPYGQFQIKGDLLGVCTIDLCFLSLGCWYHVHVSDSVQ